MRPHARKLYNTPCAITNGSCFNTYILSFGISVSSPRKTMAGHAVIASIFLFEALWFWFLFFIICSEYNIHMAHEAITRRRLCSWIMIFIWLRYGFWCETNDFYRMRQQYICSHTLVAILLLLWLLWEHHLIEMADRSQRRGCTMHIYIYAMQPDRWLKLECAGLFASLSQPVYLIWFIIKKHKFLSNISRCNWWLNCAQCVVAYFDFLDTRRTCISYFYANSASVQSTKDLNWFINHVPFEVFNAVDPILHNYNLHLQLCQLPAILVRTAVSRDHIVLSLSLFRTTIFCPSLIFPLTALSAHSTNKPNLKFYTKHVNSS